MRTCLPMKQKQMKHHIPHQWWMVIWIWSECWWTSVISVMP
jgi:hypothetical protein